MTLLKQANEALRQKHYETAIVLYVRALQQPMALPQVIHSNLKIAQDRYLKSRLDAKPRVCVCGWNLAHNAAGRVATLAQLYQPVAEVYIIGCYFKKWGLDTWAPLRNFPISIHGIQVQDESQFIAQALELVLQHPCDLLHISKPRFPNILIGALYKLIWNAHVVIDIDDEELAFANATEPLALDAYLKTAPNPVKLHDLTGETFTRLAVGLAKTLDGITVVNPALQKRYGGELIRHARDEIHFNPSAERRQKSREKHGIAATEKVIIFLGTPRQHKGLRETAQAIASLKRQDVLFLIVGDFPAPQQNLKAEIQAITDLKTRFLGDQPFETIPDILALGDLCILLQDPDHLAAQYQTPAKLTDALAMGIPVLAERTPGLEELAAKNAFTVVTRATLSAAIDTALKQPTKAPLQHHAYRELLTLAANLQPLQHTLGTAKQRSPATDTLSPPLRKLLNHLPLGPNLAQLGKPAAQMATARMPNHVLAPAVLPVHPSVLPGVLPNLSIDAVIQKAADAMAQDDWSGAYECWKSLPSRPKDALNIDLLLRISRELFKLDAFTAAASALNQAAAIDSNHPGVLCEQAQQYYYHCYSSWLMLVTENEPDWYKADGLDKRPDWQTACTLIEKAETASPRNNLRRYVQAYLLLAEEAWDKHDLNKAHAALRTSLNAIGPNKLDKALSEAIFQAFDQFRDGKADERDPYHQSLQDKLKALPLEQLHVEDWLCLNDILNWNGLLLCGYVARQKAVDLALVQGKANPNNKDLIKTAIKAALDRNDTAQADDFLTRLKKISPDALDVRELDSCCELMKGNLEAFRQKWPHPPTPAEQRLREYLKRKSVAVVGPAPCEIEDGEEIDKYNVVVRMNWRGANGIPEQKIYGSKTNIVLYNAHSTRLLIAKDRYEYIRDLDFILSRRPRAKYYYSDKKVPEVLCHEYPGSFYKSLNAIPVALFNLILNGADWITAFTTNFYASAKHHAMNYRSNGSQVERPVLANLKPVLANHDLLAQVAAIYLYWKAGACNLQLAMAKVISLKKQDYISEVSSTNLPLHKSNGIKESALSETKIAHDQHIKTFLKYVYENALLDDSQIIKTNNIIDTELNKRGMKLSFIDLSCFKRFIKNKAIALVANSTQLLKHNFGCRIDQHDIVIRFNSFNLDEKYTGKKTDIHVSVYLQYENLDVFVPIRFVISNHLGRWLDTIKALDHFKQGFLLKYNHHATITKEYMDPTPSTSGFVTLLLLLKLGGFAKINLFGFTFYAEGQGSIYRNAKGMEYEISKVHDYDYEREAITLAASEYDKKTGVISIIGHGEFMRSLKC
jgi:glycosyltransferase involved in cell wall biosynthesis